MNTKTENQIKLIETIFELTSKENINIFIFYKILAEIGKDWYENFRISEGFGSNSITREMIEEALEKYNDFAHQSNTFKYFNEFKVFFFEWSTQKSNS